MSQTHAKPEKEPTKKHGDALASALPKKDAVPMPEDGGHEKSHAAHLDGGGGHQHEQTKAADKLKQGMGSNTLREPPVVVDRVGKSKRG